MNCVAALSTPQGCWMFTSVRLKADATVKSPDCMEKHGEIRFPWKVKELRRKRGLKKISACLSNSMYDLY